jgi:DNA repair/transcription protein MET18/MMS19
VFQPTDPITEKEALKTVEVLVKIIHANEDQEKLDDIQGFGREVCEECIQILREPERSLAKPAIKILCAFMSTTCLCTIYFCLFND